MINTPELRIDCPDDLKFPLVAAVTKRLREDPAVRGVNDIDGVRAKLDGGWGLVRASNTQPALVMRVEAETTDRLGEIKSLIEAHLDAARKQLS
jgi:phosphomannomutase/phosphoglucomutase